MPLKNSDAMSFINMNLIPKQYALNIRINLNSIPLVFPYLLRTGRQYSFTEFNDKMRHHQSPKEYKVLEGEIFPLWNSFAEAMKR